jgi:UDP-glucose 4-epimerase
MPAGKIFVVGGAGYIGSHTCLRLAERGYQPIVIDNLSNGHDEFVKWGPFEHVDIRDRSRLDEVFDKHRPDAVMHFAALIEVGESVKEPVRFYETNVIGTLNLLASAMAAGIEAFVFSSTCATYGLPEQMPMSESHPQAPINPYGRTKFVVEQAIKDFSAHAGLRSAILRYFNAAGADFEGRIGEWHSPETHAIPLAIDAALGRRAGFKVFGSDYPTRDGTCVRDYIHVLDLADAHVLALEYLLNGGPTDAFNLGTGHGTTVRELVAAVANISGRPFVVDYASRREGDSPELVADNRKAHEILGWAPKYSLDEIVSSAWAWHAKTKR